MAKAKVKHFVGEFKKTLITSDDGHKVIKLSVKIRKDGRLSATYELTNTKKCNLIVGIDLQRMLDEYNEC